MPFSLEVLIKENIFLKLGLLHFWKQVEYLALQEWLSKRLYNILIL